MHLLSGKSFGFLFVLVFLASCGVQDTYPQNNGYYPPQNPPNNGNNNEARSFFQMGSVEREFSSRDAAKCRLSPMISGGTSLLVEFQNGVSSMEFQINNFSKDKTSVQFDATQGSVRFNAGGDADRYTYGFGRLVGSSNRNQATCAMNYAINSTGIRGLFQCVDALNRRGETATVRGQIVCSFEEWAWN